MKKLKLDISDLRVESWGTTIDKAGAEGTVLGQSVTGIGCTIGYACGTHTEYTACGSGGYCAGSFSNHCGGTSAQCSPNTTNCAHICAD